MKKLLLNLVLLFCISIASKEQVMPLTLEPDGGNLKAAVSEQIGIVKIAISYNRPGVKGREGKIWNTNVAHYGFKDLGHGTSTAAPWRAGANENTVFSFSHPVKIEGKDIPAGEYGFFIALGESESTLIFSNISTLWGSFYYDSTQDALRVTVKNRALDKTVEWLKYEFLDQTENSATIALVWEKQMIPFKVETDYIADQVASFRKELRSQRGFYWLSWDQAAQWALQHNTNLEEALLWSDSATGNAFGGSRIFQPWTTKADILNKLGRSTEANAIMKQAVSFAGMQDIHQYGRRLLQQKRTKEAMDIFKMNYEKNPKQFTALVGMARGYSALSDYKNALKFAKQSVPLAPDAVNKTSMEGAVKKLEAGQDIN